MPIYQLLPYVLSTSFSTHPKPLTWDTKPFQSSRVHFFRHYETFLVFSALWDWFFSESFFLCSSHQFLISCNKMDVQKIPKRLSFYIFWHNATYRKLQKKSKNIRKFFSQFLVFSELLLSPVVEKVVFVFESFWALDMAPTWAISGLFVFKVKTCSQVMLGADLILVWTNLSSTWHWGKEE